MTNEYRLAGSKLAPGGIGEPEASASR